MTAGKYILHGTYKTFQPRLLVQKIDLNLEQIQPILADAMRYLGELNAYAQLVPDIDYFIRMHIAKEATTSSKIEGTKTNLEDVINEDTEIVGGLTIEERDDLEEVQNYIKAVNSAVQSLSKLPLANRLVCDTHRVLLSGVRGYTRAPGEVRRTQNWIGGGGDIATAVFVPPTPDSLPALLTDLENYWHGEDTTPKLIKCALSHYQFETIHPFLDGNGRLGRLIISLQLIDANILTKPALYISDYFERHRADYYDSLERVRVSGDYSQWVRFFLGAITETARDAKETLHNIVDLKADYERRVHESALSPTRQKNALRLIVNMYGQPIVSKRQAQEMLGVSFQTASDLVDELESLGLLQEITGDETKRRYELYEYFVLFDKTRRR
jgi:Fic family protein